MSANLHKLSSSCANGARMRHSRKFFIASFAFRPRCPVEPHRQRRVRLRLHHRVDQKPLPVGRYGIGRTVVLKSPGAELKEQEQRANFQALAAFHWGRHQLSISRVVDQFTPIPTPVWREASTGRDLPFAATAREALHVDLITT